MPRFRPLAIACAKLAVVLLFLIAFTSVRASVRAAPDGNADLSITGSASSGRIVVPHPAVTPVGAVPEPPRRSDVGVPRGSGDGG
jgi:hypothetical protein